MKAFHAVLAVCARLTVTRAHLLGHSMGTIVCQHVAAAQPRLVRSMALFGPLIRAVLLTGWFNHAVKMQRRTRFGKGGGEIYGVRRRQSSLSKAVACATALHN